MKPGKKLKFIIAGIAVIIIAGSITGVFVYQSYANETAAVVYKETSVEKGDLITGVTESGTVTIGTESQDLDELSGMTVSSTSTTTSTTNTTGSSSSSSQDSGSASSTSSTTSTTTSSVDLEVDTVNTAVGQVVAVGDPILTLTSDSVSEYRDQLEENVKTAELALAKAKLTAKSSQLSAQYTYNSNVANGNVAQSEYDTTVASLQASVDSASASVNASAAKISDYQQQLSDGKDVSAALAIEQANYSSLLAKLQTAQNDQSTQTVEAQEKLSEANLNSSNAKSLYSISVDGITDAVDDAQDDLDDANEALQDFTSLVGDGTIYAQYAGMIASIGYSAGDTLSASTAVATYEDASQITMTVSVSQEDISQVAVGNTVNIELTAYEDKVYQGTVQSMDTSTSSGSSTVSYDVTVLFAGDDLSDVYQDMTGNVTFISSQVDDVLYVSNKAIINEGTTSYVNMKQEDGTALKTEVVTGFSDGVNVEIKSGLTEGQTVLIESQVKSE